MLETVGARPGACTGTRVALRTEDGECRGRRGQDTMGKHEGEGATRWDHGVARGVAPTPPGEAPIGCGGCGEVRGREEGRGREVVAVPGRGGRAEGAAGWGCTPAGLGPFHPKVFTGGLRALLLVPVKRIIPAGGAPALRSASPRTAPWRRLLRAPAGASGWPHATASPVGFTVAIKRLHQALVPLYGTWGAGWGPHRWSSAAQRQTGHPPRL